MFLQKIREAGIRYTIGFKPVELLTDKERGVEVALFRNNAVPSRKTKRPLIVAMIGLVASGKSAVAQSLAERIGAVVVEGDLIRTLLRSEGSRLEGAYKIEQDLGFEIIRQGGVAILDSDYIDAPKRAVLLNRAKVQGIEVVFIHTVCDLDVMFGRIMYADAGHFFNGAYSKWQDEKTQGATVKLRELTARLPLHYKYQWERGPLMRWVAPGRGSWKLKELPFPIFAEINTICEGRWHDRVKTSAQALLRL